ncbi:hypothetical protein HN865_04915 [Candidatus Woesearchaeota archaeon]|jgi:hypothetical protein|nr:hypothetical protein [Candidatus Woesearchaeota archaeon]MBT7238165.1 hypothetical protein [Candidatus Woesearchaeota archaeon]
MNTTQLNPNQIITLNDYPVYSNQVLRKYLNQCISGINIPLVPVIREDFVKEHFDDDLLNKFEIFRAENPNAKYFMLDGSHRTTALTLVDSEIGVMIYETDEDIDQARKLVATGQICKNGTLNHTLEENCVMLSKHFGRKPGFMTVTQKTKKMAEENVLPLGISYLN